MIAFWCEFAERLKKVVFLIPCSGTKEERDDLSSGVEEASRGYGTKGQQGMISKLYKFIRYNNPSQRVYCHVVYDDV